MKVYHYASVGGWRDIKEGSWKSRDEPGLGACLRVCPNNWEDEGASDGAVFGLLEPEPETWVKNTEFPVAWNFLMGNVGRLLLTYEPNDELIDKSFVIDWSHRERVLGGHKDDLGKTTGELSYEDRHLAEKAYWESKVPLAEYIDTPEAISGLVLPEVITMCNVPFSMVEIADLQPRMQDLGSFEREDLLTAIERNSDLEVLTAHVS